MEQVKCECGHVNPYGTVLCESCGKPLEHTAKPLLDMRYEGSARRSQTYNKTIIDKIWNFFSSVKVGVWLIVITLIASAIGTIFPQKMYLPPNVTPAEYYEDQYGWAGKLYYELGFDNLYGSWWYILLLASIGVSLVICSLDRVVPLYRALKKQGVTRHESFLRRQRLFSATSMEDESFLETVKQRLAKRRYHVREENGNILAEKGRFSRWGPYVNHIGLIIFLIGAMLRFVPGMYVDKVLWIREGETKEIPGTNGQYFLKNEKFVFETYEKGKDNPAFNEAIDRVGSGMVAKTYQTTAVLYKRVGPTVPGEEPKLKKVKEYRIRVNDPLKYDHYALYQVDFKLNELNKMSFELIDKQTETVFGNLSIDLNNPKPSYDLGKGYRVELLSYFPDFYFDDDGNPATKSRVPNNPAFVFKMYTPDKPKGEVSFVAIRQTIEPFGDNKYKMAFAGVETRNVSALTVRRDFTLWILGVGGAIFMIGVIQGMYWNHRRIWLKLVNGEVLLAAHTNKNWFGLKNEVRAIIEGTGLMMPIDQAEEEKKEAQGGKGNGATK
ncbi:Cytochrome c biogenesis protein CcsB [Anoxybacillus sp. P3H1B]|jgi:cytochrome c biogenesis protein|uniref:Cytochrome c biogenesis protein ResB n=1 Tax=Anoxybacteroides rupiense TaxID=311460 RepID=A0ABD5IUS8_9BACL|nr:MULTISPECIES: cytochrome c biogenesis protein ResB [Anoxybacillus]KXG11114.1 Cytochrome c biogenesis protein CcsB [Anoxybacillus sp. P3H1B]MBB3906690.1 cytochrome c biogenesis protein [Anoxybacillus rupiensis]MBS2770189.1 cytochrome c biogenesis protein [Anoxybacillus rupiensis]MED5052062.1 cytochrome c biogenesis protein ResB [Anoxybacillus rupiensis]OQM45091.1 cytochrome C biogenesis protein [Anoxybacillus sp. UARK-01]